MWDVTYCRLQVRQLMVSHWSLSDSKSLQVSRTLLSILADLNNAVVLMVSTCPLISKSSSPFNNPLEIIPSAPIIIVIFMFHRFLVLKQGRDNYLSLFFTFFWFYFVLFQETFLRGVLVCVRTCMYLPAHSYEQDGTQGQFLNECFPSLRLVTIPNLKSLVCATIYS